MICSGLLKIALPLKRCLTLQITKEVSVWVKVTEKDDPVMVANSLVKQEVIVGDATEVVLREENVGVMEKGRLYEQKGLI